jgi:hypothetical protein
LKEAENQRIMISNVSAAAIAFAVSISLLIGRGRWFISCSHRRHHKPRFSMHKVTGLLSRFFEHLFNGVQISVRPEVTLHSKSKNGEALVGGIKLHFPKTEPLDEEQANFVSALMNAFCKDHLWKDGAPFPAHCMVIDLASGKVYPGIKSIKQRIKDVESACGQIASFWPGITK